MLEHHPPWTLVPMGRACQGVHARHTYLALSKLYRSSAIITSHVGTTSTGNVAGKRFSSSQFRRSDFTGQPFTGSYDASEKTSGPLGTASLLGAPRLTPRVLKQHLDNFVVGQERAKKVLSVAVYNHYQRVQEAQRREDEEREILQQQLRREMGTDAGMHPLEDEFPGHSQTAIHLHPPGAGQPSAIDTAATPPTLDKANILLLGPSGVGKTLMAKTLARVLAVPFSMSDCTPFTQAGYIGEDVEVCVQRLLAAANYDVAAAERGIICLDEIDKISTAKVSHGKDVGGEGVQQALLKIIEGTTLQIQAKQEKSARSNTNSNPSAYPTNSPLAGGIMSPPPPPPSPSSSSSSSGSSAGSSGNTTTGPSKPETYNIRTDNILFICAGAFIGLQKVIMNRVARGSIGFNSPIRSSSSAPNNDNQKTNSIPPSIRETSISVRPGSTEDKLFASHLPFFSPHSPDSPSPHSYNPLDLVEPTDLQTYGLIPELVGRIPVSAALSALDESALMRVLTEPRNSLLRQYEALFALSGVELRFTRGAQRAVARAALQLGTGARGLRTICERLLTESMFDVPGSSVKYVLVTEEVAERKAPPVYLARGQQGKFHSLIAAEEGKWDEEVHAKQKKEMEEKNKEEKEAVVHEQAQERERERASGNA